MTLALLWSINERLAGRAGLDIEEPNLGWLGDLWTVHVQEMRELRREDGNA